MDAHVCWDEFVALSRELTSGLDGIDIAGVGVIGMGPCALVTDAEDTRLRPAILHSVDMRATKQIERLPIELGGDEAITARTGSRLSIQPVGPTLAWIADAEPDVFGRARQLFMPASWLVWNLTNAYVLDHRSARQCLPLYDPHENAWYRPWFDHIAPAIHLPRLLWPGEIAGTVTFAAEEATGIRPGTPVIAGTIDALSEAVSIDAQNIGDLMLMYGTTMFLIDTVPAATTAPYLWGWLVHTRHTLLGWRNGDLRGNHLLAAQPLRQG